MLHSLIAYVELRNINTAMAIFSRPFHEILPTELVLDITDVLFASDSGLEDVVCMSHINKTIREIVTSCPTYWTDIRIDNDPYSATFAQLCVERSKAELLTLEIVFMIGFWPPHMEDIIRVLVASAPRLKALTVIMNNFDLLQTFRTALPRLRMPRLEKLLLDYDTIFHGGPDRNRDILYPKAYNLKSLTLAGLVPPLPIKARPYAKLTSLRLGNGTMFAWRTGIMSQIVRHATGLEELFFEAVDTVLTADEFEWTHELHCPNVRHLKIFNADAPFLVQAILHLHAPLLETVHLSEPARSTNHPDSIAWTYPNVRVHPNVRNFILYRLDSSNTEAVAREDFALFIMLAFTNITALEIGTNGTWVLLNWICYNVFWRSLERLEVHRGWSEEEEESQEAVSDTLVFVMERKQRIGFRSIKHLSLDTSHDQRNVKAMLGGIRDIVDDVKVGKLKMTPWKV